MYETAIEEVLLKDSETKKFFIGTFARDELPSKINFPCCLVLNTSPRSEPGEHWLALFYDKFGNCDYFDSNGMSPEKLNLTQYLNHTANSWKFNKQRIQGLSEYCGHYCILYLLFKCRSKTINFFRNFDQNYINNDKKLKNLIEEF